MNHVILHHVVARVIVCHLSEEGDRCKVSHWCFCHLSSLLNLSSCMERECWLSKTQRGRKGLTLQKHASITNLLNLPQNATLKPVLCLTGVFSELSEGDERAPTSDFLCSARWTASPQLHQRHLSMSVSYIHRPPHPLKRTRKNYIHSSVLIRAIFLSPYLQI